MQTGKSSAPPTKRVKEAVNKKERAKVVIKERWGASDDLNLIPNSDIREKNITRSPGFVLKRLDCDNLSRARIHNFGQLIRDIKNNARRAARRRDVSISDPCSRIVYPSPVTESELCG